MIPLDRLIPYVNIIDSLTVNSTVSYRIPLHTKYLAVVRAVLVASVAASIIFAIIGAVAAYAGHS